MANQNNDNKNDMNQDQQRQRTGQQGDAGNKPQQQRGAPTAGNRDSDRGGKMPPDKSMPGNDELDVEVGDDRSPQRAPQGGPGKPDIKRT